MWVCATDGHIGDGIWAIGIYIAPQDSAPNGKIDYPVSDVTIPAGGQVNFAGTGSDSDGDLPLWFLWQFGTGSGVADKSIEDPGSVQFNSPGIFTVTFTVTDAKGISDPTPDSRTITVTSGSNLIPKNNWELIYVDSEELVGEDGVAENAFDGSPSTIWHTAWSSASPAPPHEIRIDLDTQYSLTGFRYLPRQDGGSNGSIGRYEFM